MELKIIYFNFPFWRAEVARIPLYISNTKFGMKIENKDLEENIKFNLRKVLSEKMYNTL